MDKLIKNLDLTVIKNKLKHHSGESWDNERVQLAEQEYKRFLHLCKKFPSLTIGLTKEADIFWHYHILNTQKYAKDCETVFGHFLHHDPDMLEPDMPIHNNAIDNYINLYIKEFKLSKKEKMAHSARVVDSIVPMAHSARVSEKEMAHSARVSEKEMAHSARVSEKEMAHSARVSKQEMAHSARVSKQEMAHSARVAVRNEELALH